MSIASPTRPRSVEAEIASRSSVAALPLRIVADQPRPFRVVCAPRLAELAHLWPQSGENGSIQCTVFQCADILEVWCDTIGKARGTEPCFVVVFDGLERPIMLLPLGIERRSGVRVLTFLDGEVVDYNVPVLFSEAPGWDSVSFAGLWDQICSMLPDFDVAVLEKMPERVGGIANPMLLLGVSREAVAGHARSPALPWKELEKQIPGRADSRRKYRRLSEIGDVSFEVAQTEQQRHEFLETMLRQKARRFAETRVPGFEVAGKSDFYREATRRLGASGSVHLSALRVGDTLVATLWGLIHDSRLYHLMPAYEAGEWRRFSPGRLFNEALLRWCCSRGLAVDFGIGDEAYKQDFCNTTIALYRAVLPRTRAGRIYVQYRRALQRLRATRAWQALRPLKWQLIRTLRGDTRGNGPRD